VPSPKGEGWVREAGVIGLFKTKDRPGATLATAPSTVIASDFAKQSARSFFGERSEASSPGFSDLADPSQYRLRMTKVEIVMLNNVKHLPE